MYGIEEIFRSFIGNPFKTAYYLTTKLILLAEDFNGTEKQ